jgi:hypothetical protein
MRLFSRFVFSRLVPGSVLAWRLLCQSSDTASPSNLAELETRAARLTANWNLLNQEFQRQFDASGKFSTSADGSALADICRQFTSRYDTVRAAYAEMQEARKNFYIAALAHSQEDAEEIRQMADRGGNSNLSLQGALEQSRQDLAALRQQSADLAKANPVTEKGVNPESIDQAQTVLAELVKHIEARIATLEGVASSRDRGDLTRKQALDTLAHRTETFREALAAIPKLNTAYDIYFLARWKRSRLNCLTVDTSLPCLAPPGKKCP